MSKKKSEAAILNLIDSFSKAGLSTIEDSESSDNLQKNSAPIEDQTPMLPKAKHTEMLVTIPPEKCRPWNYADRLQSDMGNIEELAASIKSNGLQEPILVRPIIPEKDGVEYEIIFGNRRWRACSLVGKPLKAIIRNLTDQEAAICQKEENENREGLSDYSKAVSYKRLLDDGIFTSSSELAAKMNIPRQSMVDLMSYTRINPEIIKAMPDIARLKRKSAVKLAAISSQANENVIKALIYLAPQINSGRIPASKIHVKVEDYINGKENFIGSTLIKNKHGQPLFTSKIDAAGNFSLIFHKTIKHIVPKEIIEKNLSDIIDKYLSFNTSTKTRSNNHQKEPSPSMEGGM